MLDTLFSFDGWDQMDTLSFNHYNCKLKCDLGPHKTGDTVNIIYVDFDNGTISTYDEDGAETWVGDVRLSLI